MHLHAWAGAQGWSQDPLCSDAPVPGPQRTAHDKQRARPGHACMHARSPAPRSDRCLESRARSVAGLAAVGLDTSFSSAATSWTSSWHQKGFLVCTTYFRSLPCSASSSTRDCKRWEGRGRTHAGPRLHVGRCGGADLWLLEREASHRSHPSHACDQDTLRDSRCSHRPRANTARRHGRRRRSCARFCLR